MSASAEVLQGSAEIGSMAGEARPQPVGIQDEPTLWSPGSFAREQILGLVRRVFFAGTLRPVKQVVFSAADSHTDVSGLCDLVARALALETSSQVATVSRHQGLEEAGHRRAHLHGAASMISCSTQMSINLWRVRTTCLRKQNEAGSSTDWISKLAELRSYFEYAVIEGPPAAVSSEAAVLGQITDGLILVLGAHSTRKATARKLKESLEGAHSRILGTVLSERRFPIPERIYSRL
jgi:hypothetical protein